jgi:hypothetical protein
MARQGSPAVGVLNGRRISLRRRRKARRHRQAQRRTLPSRRKGGLHSFDHPRLSVSLANQS